MQPRPDAHRSIADAISLRAVVDAVAAAEDEAAALREGLAAAVAALAADAGAVIRHGAVVAASGWGDRPAGAEIVDAAEALFGDEMPALLLADENDPGTLVLAASRGLTPAYRDSLERRAAGEGAAGRAYAENRLIVVDDHSSAPDGSPYFRGLGVTAAMAAPVHERGRPIGSISVATNRPGRHYTPTEREILTSLAEHACLAVSDARSVAAVAHRAMHDALTGLANGTLFRDRLQHAVARAQRTGSPIAVLFCDLDRFKAVNDSLGHAAGDELLVAIGRRLGECVRAADTAARIGGDEFAVLLEDLEDEHHPEAVARRIVETLGRPIEIAGRELRPGVSVGVTVGASDAAGLLRAADLAMYRAKDAGRRGVAVFEEGMRDAGTGRLALAADLPGAVERGEIEVHYEPIVAVADGANVGFEALARWQHPTRGTIAPAVLTPLAEETGRIRAIGRDVLRAACARAAAEHGTVAVNLSGAELADRELPADVAATLAETGLPAERLVLAIAETALMQDPETTIARLGELKALGVRVAVSDFGTGVSSLPYLGRFPVDMLKLATRLVGGDDTRLVRAILDLAATLGLQVVA